MIIRRKGDNVLSIPSYGGGFRLASGEACCECAHGGGPIVISDPPGPHPDNELCPACYVDDGLDATLHVDFSQNWNTPSYYFAVFGDGSGFPPGTLYHGADYQHHFLWVQDRITAHPEFWTQGVPSTTDLPLHLNYINDSGPCFCHWQGSNFYDYQEPFAAYLRLHYSADLKVYYINRFHTYVELSYAVGTVDLYPFSAQFNSSWGELITNFRTLPVDGLLLLPLSSNTSGATGWSWVVHATYGGHKYPFGPPPDYETADSRGRQYITGIDIVVP